MTLSDDNPGAKVLEDARKLRLLNWLITPPGMREPSSQNALAEELGVSSRTIRDWKQAPVFRALWEKQAKDIVGDPEKVQRVLEMLYDTALDTTNARHVKAAELYLKAVDGIKPPEASLAEKKAAELSDNELEALLAEAAQREQQARYEAKMAVQA